MLSDSYDTSISVVFRVYNTAILTESFRVQNGSGSFEQYKYPISSTVAVTERKHFYYDNSDHSIYNLNLNKIAEIRYCTDGTVFNGFPSGTMNVSIRFGGVKSASGLLIVKMGNQPFDANTLSYGDLIPPQLAPVSNIESGNVLVNTQFVVPAATAADVLTLDAAISVSFTSPTGESLLADADCTESRTFTLDKLGNYTLIYRVEDANGVVNNWRYNITVIDNVPPEIVVDSDYSAEYHAGDTVTLAGMTATDNTDTAQTLYTYILIINPQHDYVMFAPGDQYTFETSGRYRIQYCARDTSGNYGIVEFAVTVN